MNVEVRYRNPIFLFLPGCEPVPLWGLIHFWSQPQVAMRAIVVFGTFTAMIEPYITEAILDAKPDCLLHVCVTIYVQSWWQVLFICQGPPTFLFNGNGRAIYTIVQLPCGLSCYNSSLRAATSNRRFVETLAKSPMSYI